MRLIPEPALKTIVSMLPGQSLWTFRNLNAQGTHDVRLDAEPGRSDALDTLPPAYFENPILQNYFDALTKGRDSVARLPDYLFEYYKFNGLDKLQKESVSYILAGQDTLLADEQGTGKTITALCAARLADAQSVLIVCPQIVRGNWEAEIWKWCNKPAYVYAPRQHHSMRATFTVVNYEMLDKFLVSYKDDMNFDMLIVDECQYLKRKTSIRTKNVLEKLSNIPMRIFMSGTPLDVPYDLFPILNVLRPNRKLEGHGFAMDEQQFIQRYCGGYKVSEERKKKDGTVYRTPPTWTLKGSSNEAELHAHLRRHCMIRHRAPVWSSVPMTHEFLSVTLADYAHGMPEDEKAGYEKLLGKLHNEENGLNALAAQYLDNLILDLPTPTGIYHSRSEDSVAHTLFAVANGQFGRGVVPPFEEISAYRKNLGLAKIPAAVDFISSFMKTYPNRKLVVFTSHKDVANTLVNKPAFAVFNPTTLTGDDTGNEKTENVKKFQEDVSCRLIVCNSAAANMGVTLTAASDILHVEMDWSGFRLAQSNCRIDRRGQTRACRAFYLINRNSLDLHMTKVVHKKSMSAAKVLGDIQGINLTGPAAPPVAVPDNLSLQQQADAVHEDDPTPELLTYWRINGQRK